jgi:putative transposase
MEFTHLAHCVYHCEYHEVLVTKYRKEVFNAGIFAYMNKKLGEITEHYPAIKIKTVNHDKDHVNMHLSIPPTISVGKVVGLIKQNTARELKQKFPHVKKMYWGTDGVWSDGYFVATVGIDEGMIKAYIEQQGQQDAGQTKFGVS